MNKPSTHPFNIWKTLLIETGDVTNCLILIAWSLQIMILLLLMEGYLIIKTTMRGGLSTEVPFYV